MPSSVFLFFFLKSARFWGHVGKKTGRIPKTDLSKIKFWDNPWNVEGFIMFLALPEQILWSNKINKNNVLQTSKLKKPLKILHIDSIISVSRKTVSLVLVFLNTSGVTFRQEVDLSYWWVILAEKKAKFDSEVAQNLSFNKEEECYNVKIFDGVRD